MSFLSLPPEIHQRILSYILSARDVAALSIQCRALHAMCDMPTRKIYDTISIYSNDESIDGAFGLLMNILKRPTLGHYVRHVESCSATFLSMEFKETAPQRGVNDEDTALVRGAVKKAGFSGHSEDRVVNMLMQRMEHATGSYGFYKYRDTLGTFIAQALIAVLIALSPNLTSMATPPPFRWHGQEGVSYPLVEFLRQVKASPEAKPYFQNLRKVYLINKSDSTWSDGRFYVPMDFLACWELFDQLPSIESIGADLVVADENDKQALESRLSNISRIAINHSHINSNILVQCISSCRILRELQYSIGGRASSDGSSPTVNPKAIIKAILGHKDSLEILDLDVDSVTRLEGLAGDEYDYESMEFELDRDGSPFKEWVHPGVSESLRSIWMRQGSLKDFGTLKELSLGLEFLVYFARGVRASEAPVEEASMEDHEWPIVADCLPESLEYLCIRGYEKGVSEELDRQVDALMAYYESGSSNLKEIKGLVETIPNSDTVGSPDNNGELLWSLTEMGYESDW
ncbi:hypothetical protein PENANT_c075G02328 [Penicillium antarcticum]|uniref:F-box domain-containing protein n=1 Tax=Penicillium antarcticum TaxID=416450 RepID=A0A1V6PQN1_9EURO|nr:uncharacterized protein N7508_000187 [Penicillium antarcticum]KAJ5319904.1 hypothetical protein N7508_000187 [Penicillium antarcticum]OQD78856.1 hypothetical protein PENANT_c075G02328 [Penicillium antarcticum]